MSVKRGHTKERDPKFFVFRYYLRIVYCCENPSVTARGNNEMERQSGEGAGVTLPIERFQKVIIPPESPEVGIAAQSQDFSYFEQRWRVLSIFDFVSTKQMISCFFILIKSFKRSTILGLEIPMQFQQRIQQRIFIVIKKTFEKRERKK